MRLFFNTEVFSSTSASLARRRDRSEALETGCGPSARGILE
jgi:hypothetical protein